jgi:predicted ATP-grasp superfamily ATP-dependent carboligase
VSARQAARNAGGPAVLLVEADGRKGVAAVRSLGRAGYRVVLTHHSSLAAPRGSRFCAGFLRTPSPARAGGFWDCVRAELDRHPYDVALPLEADALEVMSRRRAELPARTAFPFPPHEALEQAADKYAVVSLAQSLGLPAPHTCLPHGADDLAEALRGTGLPAVIKPRRGQGSHGVKRVETESELHEWWPRVTERFGPAMVQEFIPPGGEFGVSLLLDAGQQVLARFAHRRLRSYPVSGGPSTLRESVHVPEMEGHAERLLRGLGWSGVAMVEFRRDPRDGTPKLMEVNHRFWGSLQLAIVSGVDFPALLCRMAMGEKFAPVTDYPDGVQCRWLFPGDLMHFLSNPDRFRLKPSFFRFVGRELHYDVASAADPMPMLWVGMGALAGVLRPSTWRRVVRRESH